MNLNEALANLLPDTRATGRATLLAALDEAWRRRRTNTEAGGAVIHVLMHEHGMSQRDIEAATGIPRTTVGRWSTPPAEADRPAD